MSDEIKNPNTEDEEYQLEPEDEVDFAQARYIFLE